MQATAGEVRYIEERFTMEAYGLRVPVALTIPTEGKPKSAVVLVPGSLYLDVDGNMPFMRLNAHAYADIARQLAARGHAVLRYAKPGPGTGTEVIDAEAARRQQHFAARADVARAAIDVLLSRVSAPLILAGHSEGAVVALMHAPGDERVRGVVLLSGPSTGLFDIMREQLPLPPGSPASAYAAFDRAVGELRAGRPIPEELRADPMLAMFGRIDAAGVRYITEVDAVDPKEAITHVEAPLLIIQGEQDASVRPWHADALVSARGTLPTQVARFPGLQHFYKRVEDGTDPMRAFMLDGESDEGVAAAISAWIDGLGLSARR